MEFYTVPMIQNLMCLRQQTMRTQLKKQNSTLLKDRLVINFKKRSGRALKRTYKVKNIMNILSKEDNNVEGLRDSHKKGLNKVDAVARGASLTSPIIEPSNSIPNEKLELPMPELAWLPVSFIIYFYTFCYVFYSILSKFIAK